MSGVRRTVERSSGQLRCHTPGPWVMVGPMHEGYQAAVVGADEHLIVNMGDGGNGVMRQLTNGALIAAAPMLLAALKKIQYEEGRVCSEYETCEHPGCRSSYHAWSYADEAVKATEAAILAAEREAERRAKRAEPTPRRRRNR